MRFPANEQKAILMFLGSLSVVSLMFTSWAMIRISTWIVGHDSVEYQLGKLDDFLVEAFFICRDGAWLFILEFFCGVFFLGLLWHRLYRSDLR
jgi:hypothetical protein